MATVDELTYQGLQTKDNNVLVNDLQTALQTIYSPSGEPINFDSNTPDGQFVEILANIGTTARELITAVYNDQDPSKCLGAVQDKMYQINYLTRNAGTYTRQNIAITVDKTVTLQGLDGSYDDPNATSYTVSDDSGNLWYLIDTTTLYAGTTSCPFRAKELGEVIPIVGTITNQVTIVGGVTSVINNLGYTILGTQEESGEAFLLRRDRSTMLKSQNNIDVIVAKLLALTGVTGVTSYVNNTDTTATNGTLPHYIWLIVGGGANTDIANIIYANMGGSGTRGAVNVDLYTISGQPITINFDRPTLVPLYIKFDLKVVGDLAEINQPDIINYIANNLSYDIGEDAETSKITQVAANAILSDGGGAYALNVEVSLGGTATASIGSSTGITDASIDVITFQLLINTTGTYTFGYDGTNWSYNGETVTLSDYGISVTGTPVNGDEVLIDFTEGTWTDFIASNSIANQFITDNTKITMSVIDD